MLDGIAGERFHALLRRLGSVWTTLPLVSRRWLLMEVQTFPLKMYRSGLVPAFTQDNPTAWRCDALE